MTYSHAGVARYRVSCVGLLLNVLLLVCSGFASDRKPAVSLTEINPPKPSISTVVIRGTTLIDGRGAPPLTGALVIVRGSKIVTVDRDAEPPPNGEIIDATGMTVLPGLID